MQTKKNGGSTKEVISPKVIEFMPDVQFGAKTLKIRICGHLT